MLNAIATYLETFSRAVIVSRRLGANRQALDEVHRLSIINYLSEADIPAPSDSHSVEGNLTLAHPA